MSKLTKRKALELCHDLWVWVAKQHKGASDDWEMKRGWPGMKLQRFANNCPCCEYAKNSDGSVDCERCPLINHWNAPAMSGALCMNSKSPYALWKNRSGKAASRQALIISNAAKCELAKLLK